MHSDGHDGSVRARTPLGSRARIPELLAELTIPAEADSLGLARLAAMHVAGVLGVPVSRLAELRLAVNEACALLFHGPPAAAAERVAAPSAVSLRFERDASHLCISARGIAPYRGPAPGEIGWVLLQALVEDVRMETVGGIMTLTLREPLPAS